MAQGIHSAIFKLSTPIETRFTKLNARQSYPLYSTCTSGTYVMINYVNPLGLILSSVPPSHVVYQ